MMSLRWGRVCAGIVHRALMGRKCLVAADYTTKVGGFRVTRALQTKEVR